MSEEKKTATPPSRNDFQAALETFNNNAEPAENRLAAASVLLTYAFGAIGEIKASIEALAGLCFSSIVTQVEKPDAVAIVDRLKTLNAEYQGVVEQAHTLTPSDWLDKKIAEHLGVTPLSEPTTSQSN